MEKKLGVSLREIARRWECSAPYVSKFLVRVGLAPLEDGSYSYEEATAARGHYTLVGKGQRMWNRGHPSTVAESSLLPDEEVYDRRPPCPCGYRFLSCDPPGEYCCEFCAMDAAEGYTPSQTRCRRELEEEDEHTYRSPRGGPVAKRKKG